MVAASSLAVWRKNQAKQAAAKIGTIHSFARRGEKDLLDQIADVRVIIDFSRPAARVEVIWEINVHVAMTRVCVTITFNGVPVGAQTATLVCVNTGCPLARTRVAADDPLRGYARAVPARRNKWTTRYDVRRYLSRDWLPAHQHPWIRRSRLRLSGMRAHHCRAKMENEARHG